MPVTAVKPPTPQSVSSLLTRAGFPRSARGHRRYEHSAGHHVTRDLSGGVSINWWPESDGTGAAQDKDLRERDDMLTRYAAAITGAGWAVEHKRHKLIVTA